MSRSTQCSGTRRSKLHSRKGTSPAKASEIMPACAALANDWRDAIGSSGLQLIIDRSGDPGERRLIGAAGDRIAERTIDPVENVDRPLLRKAKRSLSIARMFGGYVQRKSLARRILIHELGDRALVARQQAPLRCWAKSASPAARPGHS